MVDTFRCSKAEVFHNTGRLVPEQIKAQTGCTHLINAYFFDDALNPLGWLVIDGKVITSDQYNDWGFGVDADGLPSMTTDRTYTFISAVPILKDGKKLQRYLTPDVARRAERSAVCWMADKRVFLWCDKTKKLTREELQDELLALGVVDALMLDGGGSVQGDFPNGKVVSVRIVATYLLFWEEGAEAKDPKEETDNMKKVCLDAGHDAGNLANASPDKSYYEHEFVLDMAKRMGAILKEHGVDVTYTRKGGEEVSLAERCQIANGVKDLDLFVSLHTNAAAGTGWSTARGWEVYVYALSGSRYMAAKAIQKRAEAAGVVMRKPAIRENPSLYVIKNTTAPAVLIEQGFHTNHEDVALMKMDAYREKLAEAQAYGILDYLGISVKPKAKTEAELAVEWITGQGIMVGNTDGDLMLEQGLTRKQFAVMLYRFAKKFKIE